MDPTNVLIHCAKCFLEAKLDFKISDGKAYSLNDFLKIHCIFPEPFLLFISILHNASTTCTFNETDTLI